MKQIFVMGGGGFSRLHNDLKLEKYLLSLCSLSHPKIAFLPQASNESVEYVLKFYESFTTLGAIPSWVSLFGRVEPNLKERLLSQDIIYVGGGNTKSMLALWKEWGVDDVLKQAYNKGIILAGLSAGMLCWFEYGITDSVVPLGILPGLGLLKGSGCPHFDTEIERQNIFRNAIKQGKVPAGYALDDDTGALFIDGILHKAVKARADKQVKFIDKDSEKIIDAYLL